MTEINFEDLLPPNYFEIDTNKVLNLISNKCVLITGASGSIGSELAKNIGKFNPQSIVLFDHNENNQFFLEKTLKKIFPKINIIPRLGSICDEARIETVFNETLPHIVYHAAANKHVPLSELNPSETIQTNIRGTHIVADMAAQINCQIFVLISTDKAVMPTSVMGATKRIAEYYIQVMSKLHTKTHFLTVRFGNVLGSAGSVGPILKSQIETGGPVTITHPDMSRFFMSIPEAVKLILQSSIMGTNGEIFVLDMGEPIKVLDLAIKMINLLGNKKNIPIEFSGIRPGEKLSEKLYTSLEKIEITPHPKIKKIQTTLPLNILEKIVKLENLQFDLDPNIIKEKLFSIATDSQCGDI